MLSDRTATRALGRDEQAEEADMGELDGKVAVITGAGSGMGRASCEVFVREGAKVFAVDISGRQNETAAALGGAVVPFPCDMTDEAAVEAMFAAALDAFGKVDAMLNVAGVASGGMLADAPLEEYERIMAVNLKGVLLGTKHAIRTMLSSGGGTVTNWSSTGGLNASPGTGLYSMSKAGVIALTKAAAIEYGVMGIRANTICPGFIETEMSGGPGAGARFPQMIERNALQRAGQPGEVAEVACFLASDRASLVTGAVIAVDAGMSARMG
jgi:NAD(P)-dependent dehydrogenase (short-subunit alcohol dehydrogenase family)